ncbi:chorismate-binding protein [Synechococcus sp. RSCCF101]|uniref:chromophore lyase CpcT/CpeT n=1 Tax=Synechococcus sp. RSCCF101 TaxID=2511069 RepID=UPI0012449286|nr:chromophore lyase CpcT/CpeT [Synechococcus sp. RSCCF101]QEY32126.1 chorismate-binding protein [Synechococcus sp. RSCCF101]
MTQPITRLTRLLCGRFSNQQQAFDNPPLYAHILVQVRPLPQLAPGSLLLEQSYALDPSKPYRIRVLRVVSDEAGLRILNHGLRDEERFWGSIDDAERRDAITSDDLRYLEGCAYLVRENGSGFVGEVEPGCGCLVERKGAITYLVSRFEIDGSRMLTIDRGHSPTTHEQLWGSKAGPFEFDRTDDLSGEVPESWTQTWERSGVA